MKIERITFGKTIAMPGYNNDKPEIEATLEDGDTLESVLSALNKRLTDWHKAEYPHLYQEQGVPDFVRQLLVPSVIPIISKDTERLKDTIEDMILECKSMEELAALKPSATANGLIPQYMNKLKELSI